MIKKHYPHSFQKTDTVNPDPLKKSVSPTRFSKKIIKPETKNNTARDCLKMKQIPSSKNLTPNVNTRKNENILVRENRQQKMLNSARSWSSMLKFNSLQLSKADPKPK